MKPQKILEKQEVEMLYVLLKAYLEGIIDEVTQEYDFDDEKLLINHEDARKTLKKLSALLNSESRKDLDFSIISKKYGDWNREPDTTILEAIIKALSNSRVIEIVYYSPEKEKLSKRKVSVYAQNARYIVGYCHLAKDIRKFRKSRIVNAKITKESYTIPNDFNKKEYL